MITTAREINCYIQFELGDTFKMRLSVSARFVPRCGVEMKTVAITALTIAS